MSVLSYFHEVFLKFLLAFFWWLDVGWVVCLYEGMEDEYAWMCVNNMFLHEQWHGIECYMNILIWHDNNMDIKCVVWIFWLWHDRYMHEWDVNEENDKEMMHRIWIQKWNVYENTWEEYMNDMGILSVIEVNVDGLCIYECLRVTRYSCMKMVMCGQCDVWNHSCLDMYCEMILCVMSWHMCYDMIIMEWVWCECEWV